MGIGAGRGWTERGCDGHCSANKTLKTIRSTQPDPEKWQLVRYEEAGNSGPGLLLELVYENCKNHEGRKILLYSNLSIVDLINRPDLDPHFGSDGSLRSEEDAIFPVARFEPTESGWEMGIQCLANFDGRSIQSRVNPDDQRRF